MSVISGGNVKREIVFEGKLYKCPNCGEATEAFQVRCQACGYEFRDEDAVKSVRGFVRRLEELESMRPVRSADGLKIAEENAEISEIDKREISLIRNFIIPNRKEDLFEFLILASSNINTHRYEGMELISERDQAIADAWEAKFEQAYEKAGLSFGNTPEFQQVQRIYLQKQTALKKGKKKRKAFRIALAGLSVLVLAGLFGAVMWKKTSEKKRIDAENNRLEAIEEEVYAALEEEEYILAKAKTTALVFDGPNTAAADQAAERWDKTREMLMDIILAEQTAAENRKNAESEAALTDSILSGQSEAAKTDMEIPEYFIAGYEKAEFEKFNSFASDNGLGGTRIYIEGVLENTEVWRLADGTSIQGYLRDKDGNMWWIFLHAVPVVTETHYQDAVGKHVVCTGVYDGYSEKLEMPAVILSEMLVLEDGTYYYGAQKTLDEE